VKLRSPDLRSPAPRRAFFLAVLALAAAGLPAAGPAFRPAPDYVGGARPDQAEGARVLEEFRRAGIAGDYWLSFDLRVLPRKGPERTVGGTLYGTRGDHGPLTRLELPAAAGPERWLIRSGAQPATWRWRAPADGPQALGPADSLAPVAGTDFSVFDLQMPFLHWEDSVYEGLARVRGRPAHRLLLYPPAEHAAARPELTGVRVYLDTQFQALVQAELLGPKGEPEKSITVLDLQKVGEQWIVKSIDLRNHRTRDKTRFSAKAAAFDLRLPPATFAPDRLGESAPPVPLDRIQRL